MLLDQGVPTVTLPRDEVVKGFTGEMATLAALARSLDEQEWRAPTRCEGWSTGDVIAHVAATLHAVGSGEFEGLGTPEVTERHVAERRARSQGEVIAELTEVTALASTLLDAFDEDAWNGPAPAGVASTVGSGVESLWYDAYLHGDDIRVAVGRPSVGGDGLRASLSHISEMLTKQGWGPATLALDGQERFTVGSGEGREISGDPLAFVLAATGRGDPAAFGLDETVNIYR
jgi:uncharacterized protein (TIGR03083 family)